ncbi:MAG: response regulator [Kineosporiaceae bacterium]
MTDPVLVLVVDDQQLMRDGLSSLLDLQDGVSVVGTAADGDEAAAAVAELAPDVVLMDVRMPGADGVAATRRIREEHPACQVLMLTTFDDDEYVTSALRAGACGYLLKDMPAGDLAHAVRAAAAGVYQLHSDVARAVVSGMARTAPRVPRSGGLTERETEVVRLVGRGASNQEIARRLFLSEGTVKNHVSHVLRRLDLRDRTQIAVYAHEHGLV